MFNINKTFLSCYENLFKLRLNKTFIIGYKYIYLFVLMEISFMVINQICN